MSGETIDEMNVMCENTLQNSLLSLHCQIKNS